ncbi:hypothetical protein BCI9360_00823 [Bacillus sp. CECT 9360]|nr:hypothetical protein BCI9360_00823 [Bacillus sp. CECT 9360]
MEKLKTHRWLYFTMIYVVSYYTWLFVWRGDESVSIWGGNQFSLIAPLIASVCLANSYKNELNKTKKTFWLLLSAAYFNYFIAEAVWNYYELILKVDVPFPGWTDLFYLLYLLFFLIAIITTLQKNRNTFSFIRFLFDISIIMFAAFSLSWHFAILPIISQVDSSAFSLLVSVASPIGNLILLFGAMSIYLSNSFFHKREFFYIFFGLIIMVGTNSIYSFLTTNQQYSSGNLIDPLFSLAILLVGTSGRNGSIQKEEARISGNTLNAVKLLLSYISTILLFIVMVIQNQVINSLAIGSALAILLIIIRQVVTIRENHHLLDQLSDLAEKLEQKVEVRTRQLNRTNQRLNQAIQELTHVAYHDVLTGLSNRRKFKEQLEKSIVVASKEKSKFALLLLDLDRFKTINDTLGHEMGDLLLKEVGSRLSDCVGERGMVFRLGGDEFTVILPDIERNDPAKLAEEIQQCISSPFLLEGHKLRTATTTGISIFPDNGETIKVLLKKADTAMYKAKELEKGNFQFYKDGDESINSFKIVLENDLYEALDRNELEIHYQPQMDMLEKKVIGVEALVRWNHPKQGMVFPMDFIHLAEETGLIVPIGEWVLRNACEQVKDWQEQQPDLTLSVNISPRQIFREDFDQEVMDILEETQFEPSNLNLEITENIFMYSMEKVNAKLDRLKEAGIQISIDDFGTGYSSLSYLTRLPITSLKIDKMFIKNMLTKNEDYAVVKAIVNMAETLGLQVVAEGVESEEQMDSLIQLGCYILQGYLIGKPEQSPDFTFTDKD